MSLNRVAVVGLGEAGHELHLPALAGLDGVLVVGACDLVEERRDRAASAWGVPVFADFDTMIGDGEPDLVIVATPPETHLEYGLRTVRAGCELLMEKPFVSTLEEADELLGAAAQAGRRIALNHEFREMPIFRTVLDAARSGETGDLVFAQAWQLIDLPPAPEASGRGPSLRRTLHEAGVHLVDYLMALFGEKPVAVSASTSGGGATHSDSDAVVVLTLEFSGGRLASIIQNRLCQGERQYFEVRADTSGASLRASFGGRARVTAGLHRSSRPRARVEFGVSGLAWREVGPRRTFLARNPRDPRMFATRHVIGETLRAFREGGAPPADGWWARDVLEVVSACYESASAGLRIRLGADANHDASAPTPGAGRARE